MIYLLIPEEEAQKIEEERFNCSDPQISRRLHAIYLKSKGYSHQDISGYVGLTLNALTKIFKKYASEGLEEVKKMHYTPKRSVLEDYREQLKTHFEEHPPSSVKQPCDDIEKLTGVKKKEERVRVFLHQLGMKPRKVGGIPAKTDPQEQEDFKKSLEPLLQEAKDGKADVYFVDAAHFVLGAFLAILWSFKRLFIKTASERQRLNILGALNAVTHEMVTVINEAYINAWSIVDLMRKIRIGNPTGKIVLVLDNARYQACYVVRSAAHMMRIDLLYLPPY